MRIGAGGVREDGIKGRGEVLTPEVGREVCCEVSEVCELLTQLQVWDVEQD